MGVATAGKGKVHVTDMDNIEKSNLNRQVLTHVFMTGSGRVICNLDPLGTSLLQDLWRSQWRHNVSMWPYVYAVQLAVEYKRLSFRMFPS